MRHATPNRLPPGHLQWDPVSPLPRVVDEAICLRQQIISFCRASYGRHRSICIKCGREVRQSDSWAADTESAVCFCFRGTIACQGVTSVLSSRLPLLPCESLLEIWSKDMCDCYLASAGPHPAGGLLVSFSRTYLLFSFLPVDFPSPLTNLFAISMTTRATAAAAAA